jgi:toxin ParE1/3/4
VRKLQIVRSPAAKPDLGNIWAAIALTDKNAATRLLVKFDERIRTLCDFPGIGPERPEIAHGLRMLVEGKCLILYRLHEKTIEIVRVIHGARDMTSLF